MRREASVSPDYFQRLYDHDAHPWKFESDEYESDKYDHTLECLPNRRFRRAIEIGCADGVLTTRLAERCDSLVAVDVVEKALANARLRCAGQANVAIRNARIPRDKLPGTFDLILLSEVGCYWDSGDLPAAARYLVDATEAGGHVLMVHRTADTEHPRSGNEALAELQRLTFKDFIVVGRHRRPHYRLDLWRRAREG